MFFFTEKFQVSIFRLFQVQEFTSQSPNPKCRLDPAIGFQRTEHEMGKTSKSTVEKPGSCYVAWLGNQGERCHWYYSDSMYVPDTMRQEYLFTAVGV